jgi:hypothetical protein
VALGKVICALNRVLPPFNLPVTLVPIEPSQGGALPDRWWPRLVLRHRCRSPPFMASLQELARHSGTGVHDWPRTAKRRDSRPRFSGSAAFIFTPLSSAPPVAEGVTVPGFGAGKQGDISSCKGGPRVIDVRRVRRSERRAVIGEQPTGEHLQHQA